jgi:putative transposase
VCTAGRVHVFGYPETVQDVSAILARTISDSMFSIPIYCFMPDHLHVVLRGEQPQADSWEAIVKFKQQTGYWFRNYKPGIRWQKGFYDHIIRSQRELTSQVRYIADNPFRKGLVGRWNDYPYTGSIGHELPDVVEERP